MTLPPPEAGPSRPSRFFPKPFNIAQYQPPHIPFSSPAPRSSTLIRPSAPPPARFSSPAILPQRFRSVSVFSNNDDVELGRQRHASVQRLRTTWEQLYDKYGKIKPEEDDEIHLRTGRITKNRGRLNQIQARDFGEISDTEEQDQQEPQRPQTPDPDEDELGGWDFDWGDDEGEVVPPPWTREDEEDLAAFLRAEAQRVAMQGPTDTERESSRESSEDSEEVEWRMRRGTTISRDLSEHFPNALTDDSEDELAHGLNEEFVKLDHGNKKHDNPVINTVSPIPGQTTQQIAADRRKSLPPLKKDVFPRPIDLPHSVSAPTLRDLFTPPPDSSAPSPALPSPAGGRSDVEVIPRHVRPSSARRSRSYTNNSHPEPVQKTVHTQKDVSGIDDGPSTDTFPFSGPAPTTSVSRRVPVVEIIQTRRKGINTTAHAQGASRSSMKAPSETISNQEAYHQLNKTEEIRRKPEERPPSPLDPAYYQSRLIHRKHGSLWQCRSCLLAGGERFRYANFCKGRQSEDRCRFAHPDLLTSSLPRSHETSSRRSTDKRHVAQSERETQSVEGDDETGNEASTDDDLASINSWSFQAHSTWRSDPQPRKASTKQKQTESDLDPRRYHPTLLRNSDGRILRMCPLCRAAGGERERLAGYCRGRYWSSKCTFGADDQSGESEGEGYDADRSFIPNTTRSRTVPPKQKQSRTSLGKADNSSSTEVQSSMGRASTVVPSARSKVIARTKMSDRMPEILSTNTRGRSEPANEKHTITTSGISSFPMSKNTVSTRRKIHNSVSAKSSDSDRPSPALVSNRRPPVQSSNDELSTPTRDLPSTNLIIPHKPRKRPMGLSSLSMSNPIQSLPSPPRSSLPPDQTSITSKSSLPPSSPPIRMNLGRPTPSPTVPISSPSIVPMSSTSFPISSPSSSLPISSPPLSSPLKRHHPSSVFRLTPHRSSSLSDKLPLRSILRLPSEITHSSPKKARFSLIPRSPQKMYTSSDIVDEEEEESSEDELLLGPSHLKRGKSVPSSSSTFKSDTHLGNLRYETHVGDGRYGNVRDDEDVFSSPVPMAFSKEMSVRAADVGLRLGPGPTGRLSRGMVAALAPALGTFRSSSNLSPLINNNNLHSPTFTDLSSSNRAKIGTESERTGNSESVGSWKTHQDGKESRQEDYIIPSNITQVLPTPPRSTGSTTSNSSKPNEGLMLPPPLPIRTKLPTPCSPVPMKSSLSEIPKVGSIPISKSHISSEKISTSTSKWPNTMPLDRMATTDNGGSHKYIGGTPRRREKDEMGDGAVSYQRGSYEAKSIKGKNKDSTSGEGEKEKEEEDEEIKIITLIPQIRSRSKSLSNIASIKPTTPNTLPRPLRHPRNSNEFNITPKRGESDDMRIRESSSLTDLRNVRDGRSRSKSIGIGMGTIKRTKAELDLARIVRTTGDDEGLEWGLDEDVGQGCARLWREGSVKFIL
ncbi:hypothetical protein M231_04556 [Tremella mesenterica]|uniref:Uncharacterized protein n=1 Tax=Tremella mesenterica TaxID=5217 RepID=A0A4Q1BKP7_TREME|nr:hypothetical protein M231_04556 [Tremella mesenterica]